MSTAVITEVESTSSPGKYYRVWVDADGPVFCECPSHKFQAGKPAGQRKPCKHMVTMGASPDLTTVRDLARYGTIGAAVPKQRDRRIRFIELVEYQHDNRKEATVVGDLSRFNNLEV